MKNILFIFDYYFPNAMANGICISKLIDDFNKKGLNVSILHFDDKYDHKIYDYSKNCKQYIITDDSKNRSSINIYLRWMFSRREYAMLRNRLVDKLFEKASEIIVQDNIDTVICAYYPAEALVAGNLLKDKFPNVNFVAYMLDSLSGGFLPRFLPKFFCRYRKLKWERYLFEKFDKIVLMESSRKHHEKYSTKDSWYKNKAVYLDVPAFIDIDQDNHKKKEESKNIVISYAGIIQDNVRTPYSFLKVISEIKDPKIDIYFAGDNKCAELDKYLNFGENITFTQLGFRPYEEVWKLFENSDILLNLGGYNANLVPSKVFEYMSLGKPIISTYRLDDDSSIPYLKKYPMCFFIDEREDNYDETAVKLRSFLIENKNKTIDYESVSKLFYKNKPTAFYDLLVDSFEKGKQNEN